MWKILSTGVDAVSELIAADMYRGFNPLHRKRLQNWMCGMADKITTTTAYVASGSAVFFGLTANEFAAYVGAAVAVLTYLTNAYFKLRHLKLAEQQTVIDDLAHRGVIDRRKPTDAEAP